MTAKEILIEALKQKGFDGLIGELCGCSFALKHDEKNGFFMACIGGCEDCEPGYLHTCEACTKPECDTDAAGEIPGVSDWWCVRSDKQEV